MGRKKVISDLERCFYAARKQLRKENQMNLLVIFPKISIKPKAPAKDRSVPSQGPKGEKKSETRAAYTIIFEEESKRILPVAWAKSVPWLRLRITMVEVKTAGKVARTPVM